MVYIFEKQYHFNIFIYVIISRHVWMFDQEH